jgi:hypothetical protein
MVKVEVEFVAHSRVSQSLKSFGELARMGLLIREPFSPDAIGSGNQLRGCRAGV